MSAAGRPEIMPKGAFPYTRPRRAAAAVDGNAPLGDFFFLIISF